VRLVQRETLHQDDLFAQAPPTGGAAYAQLVQQAPKPPPKRLLAELSDDALRDASNNKDAAPQAEQVVVSGRGLSMGKAPAEKPVDARRFHEPKLHASGVAGAPPAPPRDQAPPNQLEVMARNIQASNKSFVVEGFADKNDHDKYAASLERANRAREQLIRNGVDPSRVVAVGSGEKEGKKGGVTIVEAAAPVLDGDGKPDVLLQKQAQALGTDPIGTSHFESKARMTVQKGTSAMVSILSTDTTGEVVYFYDPESPRGNASYPFRAVRVQNPTDSVLEQGPVTVFGEGKFIGEGLVEPIAARSTTFIPFALDRQIMVETKESEVDRIARIITVQRGVFSTEVQHTKRTVFVLNNRSSERATVYVRHQVAAGYQLTKAPGQHARLGTADLFRVDVDPGAKADVTIEEATPLFKSTDIRSPAGMDMVTAYLSASAVEGPLKSAVSHLLELHREMANAEQQIATTREQMAEYRARMDELHAQVVTLKAVKTAGPLMQSLEKKLQEVSDKLSKATIDVVALQEKLMVARIKFQDGVADLSLEKKPEPPPEKT
jgi:hypothetical protein